VLHHHCVHVRRASTFKALQSANDCIRSQFRTHCLSDGCKLLALPTDGIIALTESALTRLTAVPMPRTTMPVSPSKSNFCW